MLSLGANDDTAGKTSALVAANEKLIKKSVAFFSLLPLRQSHPQ